MKYSPAEPAVSDKPKRRWYQFSLRFLLVLTLLVGIGCAWWHHQIRRRERVELAVRLLGECHEVYDGFFYNPVPVIRAVNHLQSMGKGDSLKALRRAAAMRPNADAHQSLQLVVPLLFERMNPEDKLPARPSEYGKVELELDTWNNYLDVEGEVPFHTRMVTLMGREPENAYLVNWAEQYGRLRSAPLHPTDDLFGAADRVAERLRQQKKDDPDAPRWIAYLIREQVNAAVTPVISRDNSSATGDFPNDDVYWNRLRSECQSLGLRWSPESQEYVASKGRTP
jgi:hypothetical protein